MNCIVPFTKDVKFDTALGDILSISLEHEHNLSNNILLGNFTVSGTYKTHELSANALAFSKVLPFELSLGEDIDEETLSFSIDNFTYEVKDGDILSVDIDYLVKAKEIIKQRTEEEVFSDDALEFDDLVSAQIDKIFEVEDSLVVDDDRVDSIDEVNHTNTILDFASENKESFISYKIHTMKDGENIETICKLYSKSENDMIEYNLGVGFNAGDKILIPEDDE